MNRKNIAIAAILAYIAIIVGGAATKAFGANQVITLQPGDTLTVTAAQGGSGPPPPGTITCSDGSVHTLPYTCPVTPPPGTDTADHCNGFVKTIHMRGNWAAPTRMLTSTYGGMAANDIVVYEFTTGSGASSQSNLPRIAGGEYGGGAADRVFNLSSAPCDFSEQLAFASHGTGLPSVPFNVGVPDMFGFYPSLKLNTTYFFNVKVAAGSGCTTSCDMFFDLQKNSAP